MGHFLFVGGCWVCLSPYRTGGHLFADIGPGRRWWRPLSLGPPLEARVIGGGTLSTVLLGSALCLLGSVSRCPLCENLVSASNDLLLDDSRDGCGVGHHGDFFDVKVTEVSPE